MKFRYAMIFCMIMFFSIILAGCESGIDNDTDKMKIVCTNFPQYDWVRELTKDIDDIDIYFLLNNGVDMHSYQPSASDIITISDADMFIYVGGESDKWVDSTLKQSRNEDICVINMMDILGDGIKEEKEIEGMEEEETLFNDENYAEVEYDEHVWLSLNNAEIICDEIRNQLIKMLPDKAKEINDNYQDYIGKINELDIQYRDTVKYAGSDTIVIGDRFPFVYLFDDYKIKCYAAFAGCSADTNASFNTIIFLANKLDEIGLKDIVIVDNMNMDLANTVIDNCSDSNKEILSMYSLQAVTRKDVENGMTYIGVMAENLEVINKVLNSEK